jgi:hypothetical protein
LVENKIAAVDGGTVAGNARRETEKKIGRSVVSEENYLGESESQKRSRINGPTNEVNPKNQISEKNEAHV